MSFGKIIQFRSKNHYLKFIPKSWKVVRLREVIDLKYGKGLPETKRKNGKYPVLGSNGIIGYHNRPLVRGPGIIIGRKGSIGEVYFVEDDFWPIDTAYFVFLKQDINWQWLFYMLKLLNFKKYSLSDVVPGLKRELALSEIIPIPPLPEQKRIAEVLRTVDLAIEKVEQEIEHTERLKRGLMQHLLTRGIGHTRFKDSPLGTIPMDWEVVRLKKVVTKCENGVWGTNPTESNEGIPVIRSTEIQPDGTLNLREVAYRNLSEREIEKYKLQKGDIIIVSSSGSKNLIGRAAFFDINGLFLFSNFTIRIRTNYNFLNPRFLFYFLSSPQYRRYLLTLQQTSTGLRNLRKNDLLSLLIPLPPLPEQKKIAEILRTVDQKLELLRHKKYHLERLKKGLMNDLLTGKRRLKVMPAS